MTMYPDIIRLSSAPKAEADNSFITTHAALAKAATVKVGKKAAAFVTKTTKPVRERDRRGPSHSPAMSPRGPKE